MSDYSDDKTLLIEARTDGVVVVTLNRPDRLNAFDGVMREEIRRMLRQIRDDDAARAMVLTGAGRGIFTQTRSNCGTFAIRPVMTQLSTPSRVEQKNLPSSPCALGKLH